MKVLSIFGTRPKAIKMAPLVKALEAERIVAETIRLLQREPAPGTFSPHMNPYGDGHAAARIVAALAGRMFEEFSPHPSHSALALAAE